jgi:hypothetical protein
MSKDQSRLNTQLLLDVSQRCPVQLSSAQAQESKAAATEHLLGDQLEEGVG